jgi:YD repeat-containing protein
MSHTEGGLSAESLSAVGVSPGNVTTDANGNITAIVLGEDTYCYSYDYENRLIEARYPDNLVIEFVYDGLGRRTITRINGQGVRYVYDGYNVIQERDERTDELITEYTYLQGNVFKQKRGTEERWFYNQPEGGYPNHVFGVDGAKTDSLDFGWFGELAYHRGETQIALGWAGGWVFAQYSDMPFVLIPESNEVWLPKVAKSLNPLVKSSFSLNLYSATRGSSNRSGCCGMLTSNAVEDPDTDVPCYKSTIRKPGVDIYIPLDPVKPDDGDILNPPQLPTGPPVPIPCGSEMKHLPMRSVGMSTLGVMETSGKIGFNTCCESQYDPLKDPENMIAQLNPFIPRRWRPGIELYNQDDKIKGCPWPDECDRFVYLSGFEVPYDSLSKNCQHLVDNNRLKANEKPQCRFRWKQAIIIDLTGIIGDEVSGCWNFCSPSYTQPNFPEKICLVLPPTICCDEESQRGFNRLIYSGGVSCETLAWIIGQFIPSEFTNISGSCCACIQDAILDSVVTQCSSGFHIWEDYSTEEQRESFGDRRRRWGIDDSPRRNCCP